MTIRTIKRNSKELKDLISKTIKANSYTLRNGFNGEPISLKWFHSMVLYDANMYKARVIERENGWYQMTFNQNSWIEFFTS
jgi:hypothetical protein